MKSRIQIFKVLFYLISIVNVIGQNDPTYKTPLYELTGIFCNIGYGQSGAAFEESQTWPRRCRDSDYCWKGYTDSRNLEKLQNMFIFPWNYRYETFFVQGCGGYLGTPVKNPRVRPIDWEITHPDTQFIPPSEINITAPVTVRVPGGSLTLTIDYTCMDDLCSAGYIPFSSSSNIVTTMIISTIMMSISTFIF